MTKSILKIASLGTALALMTACASADMADDEATMAKPAANAMSFFITSVNPGGGANLGGLAGADAHCTSLASAVGAGGKTWRAYLSTTGAGGVNAKDRIGSGPWFNANGALVANSVAELHPTAPNLTKETAISETGEMINGRGDEPNRHDIITGTMADGTASTEDKDTTCGNWTSESSDGSALAGHHDRIGGGPDPTSWNSAHGSRGCALEHLRRTGGDGLYYCFAAD